MLTKLNFRPSLGPNVRNLLMRSTNKLITHNSTDGISRAVFKATTRNGLAFIKSRAGASYQGHQECPKLLVPRVEALRSASSMPRQKFV